MTDKTRSELVEQALAYLGLKQSNQAANADDTDIVDGLVEAAIDELEALSIIRIPDYEAIEPAVFLPVAVYLANAAKPALAPAAQLDVGEAVRKLRVIAASQPTGEPQIATYY